MGRKHWTWTRTKRAWINELEGFASCSYSFLLAKSLFSSSACQGKMDPWRQLQEKVFFALSFFHRLFFLVISKIFFKIAPFTTSAWSLGFIIFSMIFSPLLCKAAFPHFPLWFFSFLRQLLISFTWNNQDHVPGKS